MAGATEELERDRRVANENFDAYIEEIHGQYLNEDDFYNGVEGYRSFVKDYISYKYEPANEAFEEAKYFTKDFDTNMIKKCRIRPSQKIDSIYLKH